MPITLWIYVPPVVGVVAITLLLVLLRRRLWTPAHRQVIRASQVAPWRQAQVEHELAWRAIADRCGERIAGLLTTGIGAAFLFVAIWALAYVGWTAMYFGNGLSTPPALPPWFGNPLNVIGFAIVGTIVTVVALLAIAIFIGAAWFVGTCLLWPDDSNPDKADPAGGVDRP